MSVEPPNDEFREPSDVVAYQPDQGTPSVEHLMAQAIDKGDVASMEKLMSMRREIRAERAKEQYDAAMAAFQASCPTIKKTKKVLEKGSNRIRYSYAPLEDIVAQVKALIEANGFSYKVNAIVEPGWVTATCRVTHLGGHAETSELKVPIDPNSYMGEAQKFASAFTFSKRYAFCAAFGILTGDDDDDANSAQGDSRRPDIPKPQKGQNFGKVSSKPVSAKPSGPVESDAERKTRFLAMFKGIEPYATEVFKDHEWLMDNEVYSDIDISHIPRTKKLVDLLVAEVKARAGASENVPDDHDDLGSGAGDTSAPLDSGSDSTEGLAEPGSGPLPEQPDLSDCEQVRGKLTFVSVKEGDGQHGPWKRFGLKINDEWYSTFDTKIGHFAITLQGRTVTAYFSRGQRGNDLIWLI